MSRGSSKPCPGCGEVVLGRPAKKVCDKCKRLLERVKWLEDVLSRLSDNDVVVRFGERSHWNEYLFTRTGGGRDLMKIFLRIAEAASLPTDIHPAEFELLGEIDSGAAIQRTMNRSLAEAIRDLRAAVGEVLDLEYEAGKADGHKLLMRLADGDLSMNEFDKLTNKE